MSTTFARSLPLSLADACEIAEAWEAFACRTHARVKVHTAHGPRRAHVLHREGSWVVTMREGDGTVRLTLGPLGLAVRDVSGREPCIELLRTIVEAGHRDAPGVSRPLGLVIEAWMDRFAPELRGRRTSDVAQQSHRS